LFSALLLSDGGKGMVLLNLGPNELFAGLFYLLSFTEIMVESAMDCAFLPRRH
jgi:hypothetical protein